MAIRPVFVVTFAFGGVLLLAAQHIDPASKTIADIAKVEPAAPKAERSIGPTATEQLSFPPIIADNKEGTHSALASIGFADVPSATLRSEIVDLESLIERDRLVARLNAGDVTKSERNEFGQILHKVMAMKAEILLREVSDVEAKYAELMARRPIK